MRNYSCLPCSRFKEHLQDLRVQWPYPEKHGTCQVKLRVHIINFHYSGVLSKDEQVLQVCDSLVDQIPAELDLEAIRASEIAEGPVSPLRVVLLQEVERYNALLRLARRDIRELRKGIAGTVVISEDLEKVMSSLVEGNVPQTWKSAYLSLKPLNTWVIDLQTRLDQLSSWASNGTPIVFWLGGLTYPTCFLTAILQQSARKNAVSVDTLSFDFVVQQVRLYDAHLLVFLDL
jgi:dynein heavy chain